MEATARADELYAALAQQSGGIEPLLESFFGFLYRKTDFYVVADDPARRRMGFAKGVAQQKVLEAFNKYPLKWLDGEQPPPPAAARTASAPPVAKAKTATAPIRVADDGKQLPVGNGGRTDKYAWTQTLEDVTIQVEVPEGTRARDLTCEIRATHLRVALKTGVVLIDGDLPERIRPDESVWSIENNHTLHLSLEKIKPTWWASAVVGDAEIDTSQVDSTRQIGEYDDATQGAIRKAMFDQQQRQLGLPTSDEMETERILAHARNLPDAPI